MNDAAPWTVLLYMAAGRDVEKEAREDRAEVLARSRSSGVGVYLLFDGPAGCERRAWSGGREQLAVEGEDLNVGDPRSLVRALAESEALGGRGPRALVVWGHGTGWVGRSTPSDQPPLGPGSRETGRTKGAVLDRPAGLVAPDPQTGDWLDTAEVEQALEAGLGDRPLGLLALDACHMAGVELLARLAPQAEVIVASADRMAAGAWAYDELLRTLAEPGAGAEQAARVITESYRGAMARDGASRSIVAVRGPMVVGVMRRLDELGDTLVAGGGWQGGRLRRAIDAAGVVPYGDRAYYGYDLADVVKVLACAGAPEGALALARLAVADAERACCARWVGDAASGRVGLSVFLGHEAVVPAEYADVVPVAHGWQRFLRAAWGQGG